MWFPNYPGRTSKRDSFQSVPPDTIKSSRKIANNTFEWYRTDGTRIVRLHRTDIIEFHSDGTVLNSGGWQTVTTKDRINRFSPYSVYSDKGIWYVRHGAKECLFVDGIKLPGDFDHPAFKDQEREKRKLANKILKGFASD